MHLPTYLVLMIFAVIYGLYKTIILWQTNWLLFSVSIIVTIITLAGAILQFVRADDFEFKWMLCYVIPLGLLALSGFMQNTELSDSIMRQFDITPPAHIIPGVSQDYKDAVTGHFISMAFPLIAWAISKLFQLLINNSAKSEKA